MMYFVNGQRCRALSINMCIFLCEKRRLRSSRLDSSRISGRHALTLLGSRGGHVWLHVALNAQVSFCV